MPYNVEGGYINWQEKKSQLQIIKDVYNNNNNNNNNTKIVNLKNFDYLKRKHPKISLEMKIQ